jgi:F0F1-type ATP synthase membrane subunit b/b'
MMLDPLGQIHLVTIGAVVVIFLATLGLLRRIVFLPLITVMEHRALRIAAAQRGKTEAEQLLQTAQRQAEQARAAARAEAERVVAALKEEASEYRRERMARANAASETILTKGRDEVAALRQSQDQAIAEELGTCVTRTLTSMVGAVDGAAVRYIVKTVLAAKEGG